ncbi:hypothetical protein Hanom_Chr05g00450421 [Helianthus anomalus]
MSDIPLFVKIESGHVYGCSCSVHNIYFLLQTIRTPSPTTTPHRLPPSPSPTISDHLHHHPPVGYHHHFWFQIDSMREMGRKDE